MDSEGCWRAHCRREEGWARPGTCVMHQSTPPVRLSLRRFPNLTYPPLSLVFVALPVVTRMHDELCIGDREMEHRRASSDPETALLRYVLGTHRPLLHMHTHDEERALGGPPFSTWKVQRSRSRIKSNPPLLCQHISTSGVRSVPLHTSLLSRSNSQRRERKA